MVNPGKLKINLSPFPLKETLFPCKNPNKIIKPSFGTPFKEISCPMSRIS